MSPLPVQIIFLDLDGTLLSSGKQISPGNVDALKRTQQAGVRIVPCSGRMFPAVQKLFADLQICAHVITLNGAEIYDAASGQCLYRESIPLARAVEIVRYAYSGNASCGCFQAGRLLLDSTAFQSIPAHHKNPFCLEASPLPDVLWQVGAAVEKITVNLEEQAERERMIQLFSARFPEASVTSSRPGNLEIGAKTATKADAMCYLCGKLHIPMEQVLACGDSLNDIGMLQTAGIGVAMGNAEAPVLKASKYCTACNDDDGVARAIARFVL